MKIRISCLLLSFLFLLTCMVGCGDVNNSEISNSGTESNQIGGSQENETETQDSQQVIYASVIEMTFEECVANATNILSAKYLGVSIEGSLAYLSFQPISQIKGEVEEETFLVVKCLDTIYTTTTGYQYAGDYSRYVEGEEYLLVLEKRVSVYYDRDRYYVVGDIFISKDAESTGTMFGTVEMDQFVTGDIGDVNSYGGIISYVTELSQKFPADKENDDKGYIRSSDLQEIVAESNYIFKVKVVEYDGGAASNNTERFYCEISSRLKGFDSRNKVLIVFSAGTVEIGDECIVMLDKPGEYSLFYILSSKNSVYPTSDTESIAIIKNALSDDHVKE